MPYFRRCTKCGGQIPEKNMYCPHCGGLVNKEESPAYPEIPDAPATPSYISGDAPTGRPDQTSLPFSGIAPQPVYQSDYIQSELPLSALDSDTPSEEAFNPFPGVLNSGYTQDEAAPPLCPNCSSTLRPNSRFCNVCGSPVPDANEKQAVDLCPICSRPRLPNAKFCNNCGYAFIPPAPQPPFPSAARTLEMCSKCYAPRKSGAKFCQECGFSYAEAEKRTSDSEPAPYIDPPMSIDEDPDKEITDELPSLEADFFEADLQEIRTDIYAGTGSEAAPGHEPPAADELFIPAGDEEAPAEIEMPQTALQSETIVEDEINTVPPAPDIYLDETAVVIAPGSSPDPVFDAPKPVERVAADTDSLEPLEPLLTDGTLLAAYHEAAASLPPADAQEPEAGIICTKCGYLVTDEEANFCSRCGQAIIWAGRATGVITEFGVNSSEKITSISAAVNPGDYISHDVSDCASSAPTVPLENSQEIILPDDAGAGKTAAEEASDDSPAPDTEDVYTGEGEALTQIDSPEDIIIDGGAYSLITEDSLDLPAGNDGEAAIRDDADDENGFIDGDGDDDPDDPIQRILRDALNTIEAGFEEEPFIGR